MEKRLGVYSKETEPLVEYYKILGKLTEINADGTPDAVERLLISALSGG